jgi:hypothetical protein
MAAARAYRVGAFGAALGIVGIGIDASFWWISYGQMPRMHLVSMATGIALLGALYARRKQPSLLLGSLAFTVSNAVVLAALWGTDTRLAHSAHWDPFDAQKLGALTVAMLAPPSAWVGVLNIAGFTLAPMVEVFSWPHAVRAALPPEVPFASIAYGVFAIGVLALQLRRLAREYREAQHQAQAATTQRFATMVLALRDLANSPLQTIELTLARLRAGGDPHPEATARLHRACGKLIQIARVLEDADSDARARAERLSSR